MLVIDRLVDCELAVDQRVDCQREDRRRDDARAAIDETQLAAARACARARVAYGVEPERVRRAALSDDGGKI